MLCATFAAPPSRRYSDSKLHHRDRRFRRDARHAADDEAIEHDVADDEHRLAGETGGRSIARAASSPVFGGRVMRADVVGGRGCGRRAAA